eukprot:562776-Prorocentrum_minimum.AAC.1
MLTNSPESAPRQRGQNGTLPKRVKCSSDRLRGLGVTGVECYEDWVLQGLSVTRAGCYRG